MPLFSHVNTETEDTYRHRGMRRQLMKDLAEKGIHDRRVLEAMGKVPRHLFFFDTALIQHAYEDKAFPIGEGQTISQPYTVAFQTQLLQIEPGMKVLEIGTGSGYQTCILELLGSKVFSVEYQEKLFFKAGALLRRFGSSAALYHGDGTKGLPAFAPFDRILVTAAAASLPPALIDQLKIGGLMVVPVGEGRTQIMMRIFKKSDRELLKEEFGTFSFVPFIGTRKQSE